MRKFIIERNVDGIGSLPPEGYCAGAKRSNDVLRTMGPGIQWLESFVTGDKLFCVYFAENEDSIHEHAERSGFPAHRVLEVRRMLDPATQAS